MAKFREQPQRPCCKFRAYYDNDDRSLQVNVFDDEDGTSFELWNAWTDTHLRDVRVEPPAGTDEAHEIARLMMSETEAARVVVVVTDNPDDLGRQSFTTSAGDHRVDLFGYPCDHIAAQQAEGHDVLVKGRIVVLPFGMYRSPAPIETPGGRLFPARQADTASGADQ